VIGPNGAGKTTLLRAISKLVDVSGAISMNGRALASVPAHEVIAHGISHVPENRRLFPRLTVEENLKMGAFLPEARGRFAERLEFVYSLFPRMRERRAQPAGTLSGGEQQMCAIGRALMSGPKLLLLDEPSLGLAPLMVAEVMRSVRSFRETGVTVLLVEQNANLALQLADRGYVMETGSVRMHGSGAELLANAHVRASYLGHTRGGGDVV
jgi:branched-chain amino acid transport system ATP-binding protein